MNDEQNFRGVKFSERGWSISSISAENIQYLSRVLSQAVAYLPTPADERVTMEIGDLAGAQLVVIRNAEVVGSDLVLELFDVGADKGVTITLNRQAYNKHVLTIGTVVRVRSVSSGFVVQLGSQGAHYEGHNVSASHSTS
jgi:hypothetical protein